MPDTAGAIAAAAAAAIAAAAAGAAIGALVAANSPSLHELELARVRLGDVWAFSLCDQH